MSRIILALIGACILLAACTILGKKRPLQRGLVGETFVSTGQPAFALQAEPYLALKSAGVMDLQLQTPQLGSTNASASCWYALYVDEGDEARAMPPAVRIAVTHDSTSKASALLAILVDAQNPWQWEMSVASGHLEVHADTLEIDGKPAHAATYVLTQNKDPWAQLMSRAGFAGQSTDTLVRRFTLLMQKRRAKLIIEYREPLMTSSAVRPLEDFAALAAFEQRAREAFNLYTSPSGKAPTVTQLTYAPDYIQRKSVAASLGMVRRSNQKN